MYSRTRDISLRRPIAVPGILSGDFLALSAVQVPWLSYPVTRAGGWRHHLGCICRYGWCCLGFEIHGCIRFSSCCFEQLFFNVSQLFFNVFQMFFNVFQMFFKCFSMFFKCLSILFKRLSRLFNAFQCFSMFFKCFSMPFNGKLLELPIYDGTPRLLLKNTLFDFQRISMFFKIGANPKGA